MIIWSNYQRDPWRLKLPPRHLLHEPHHLRNLLLRNETNQWRKDQQNTFGEIFSIWLKYFHLNHVYACLGLLCFVPSLYFFTKVTQTFPFSMEISRLFANCVHIRYCSYHPLSHHHLSIFPQNWNKGKVLLIHWGDLLRFVPCVIVWHRKKIFFPLQF